MLVPMTPAIWQRLEGGALAVFAMVGAIALGAWWWPLALFLVFDLSALGYLRGTRAGAFGYNLVHSYWGPALLGAWVVAVAAWNAPGDARWILIVASSWLFHVGVDRALGYGLKLDDSFQHTHLGWIGKGGRDPH